MSLPQNPYAAPSAEVDSERPAPDGSEHGIYREGAYLVIPARGASLPGRCVVCNAPGQTRLVRKLYWHPGGYYFLILISVVIYAIVAVIVRKRAHFELALCDRHARRRRLGVWLALLGCACFIGVLVASVTDVKSELLFLLLALGLVACPIAALLLMRVVTAHRIDDRRAWLRVGRPFLDSF